MLSDDCCSTAQTALVLQGPHDLPCIKRSLVSCLQALSAWSEPQSGVKPSAAEIVFVGDHAQDMCKLGRCRFLHTCSSNTLDRCSACTCKTAATYVSSLELVLICYIHISEVPPCLMQQADAKEHQAPQLAHAQQHAES